MDKGRFLTTHPGSHSSVEHVTVCQGTQGAGRQWPYGKKKKKL